MKKLNCDNQKKISLHQKIYRFILVGGLAFIIDFGILYILTDIFNLWYMISAMISFSVSTVFNYWASMRYIFSGRKNANKNTEFVIFVVLSVISLGINELGMFLMVSCMNIHYLFSKVVMTGIIMVWNFITRKIFLDNKND